MRQEARVLGSDHIKKPYATASICALLYTHREWPDLSNVMSCLFLFRET